MFKNILPVFEWMTYIDRNKASEKVLCMPHMKIDGKRTRISFCPSCGTNIRSIEIDESKFKEDV